MDWDYRADGSSRASNSKTDLAVFRLDHSEMARLGDRPGVAKWGYGDAPLPRERDITECYFYKRSAFGSTRTLVACYEYVRLVLLPAHQRGATTFVRETVDGVTTGRGASGAPIFRRDPATNELALIGLHTSDAAIADGFGVAFQSVADLLVKLLVPMVSAVAIRDIAAGTRRVGSIVEEWTCSLVPGLNRLSMPVRCEVANIAPGQETIRGVSFHVGDGSGLPKP